MSTVIQFAAKNPIQSQDDRYGALVSAFASSRRFGDDVFWLKENAELLSILEVTGAKLSQETLAPMAGFYANVEKRLGFFPQYYRFILSLCLDLEDLGMEGNKGEALVNWAADEGLAQSEMSDLQRMEARRLMLRRGRDPLPADPGLEVRMRAFIERSEAFTMPNKKAAYELTHTVFYLSEYGRKPLQLGEGALKSLRFAGTLAWLDQNLDLVAEVCIALRYAGEQPPAIWENWAEREGHRFTIATGEQANVQDNYHEFFICNWLASVSGGQAFTKRVAAERMSFHRPDRAFAPLREMSECMFRLDDRRSADWDAMRPLVTEGMNEEAQEVLGLAEQSCPDFDAFFAGFARVGLSHAAV
ncbi:hypothetical protein [Litorivita sp. NS0012-18]|uniref:DUF6902 family protein n=1 Tax=Litorivita sp. NS0012-18 TaxID=3127655 RepID=UPI003103DE31